VVVRTIHISNCPHCAESGALSPLKGTSLARCDACGFILPCESPDPVVEGSSSLLDLDDETWTGKWGPIRADRYHVERVLASGAQGTILLAHHRHLDQECVIKIVSSADVLWADTANRRLRHEAQAGVRVNHPNVARVYDCDCADDTWYFVMEYIRGQNLRDVLRHAVALSAEQVTDIARQAAVGLAAIHESGLVHRDVKPSNLMLCGDGRIKIMDLGLVKSPDLSSGEDLTHSGQVVGTPLYMPPEQFDASDSIDARADIYALGATLFHLLTGQAPFEGRNFKEIAERHRRDPVTWNTDAGGAVPKWLRTVVEHCLAKHRDHRFSTAGAILEALDQTANSKSKPPLHLDRRAREGVAVLAFENLSRKAEDEWIGDAIAEYLSSRLSEFEGIYVADRSALARVIDRSGGDGGEGSHQAIADAARLNGVEYVVMGSFQRVGGAIRIVARSLSHDPLHVRQLASVSGEIDALFQLEDELTERITAALKPLFANVSRRRDGAGQTRNLAAHEHYIHGKLAFDNGDYQAAIDFANRAIDADSEYDEPVSLIGASYARLGDYDRAVEYHHRQESAAHAAGDDVALAGALGNLGAMYYYKGEYPVAFDFLDRAAKLIAMERATPDAAKLFGNLGMVLMRLGKNDEAIVSFDRAISICKQFKDVVSMVWPYNGMGSVLLNLERYTEAKEFHQRALDLSEQIGDRVTVGVTQMNMGRCACLIGDFSEAAIWFGAALGSLERTKFWNGLTLVYEHMAEMHLLENEPTQAINAIDQRIELAARHGNRRMEAQAWEQKARAFEQLGQTNDALAALKTSLSVSQRPEPYESLHRYLADVASRKPFR
jgi:serine/threonine protein kinase/Tfp pilus assembly protein PilF